MPSSGFGDILELLKFPSPHRTGTEISNAAVLYHIIQCTHYFFHRCIAVQSMDLEDINIRIKPLAARSHGVQDVLPGETDSIYKALFVLKPKFRNGGLVYGIESIIYLAEYH
jgi:hypothetical protein